MPSQRERIIACAAACYVLMSGYYLLKKKRRKRRWWMKSSNKNRTRCETNMLCDLIKEPGKSENFCRMSTTDFEYLLNEIGPQIARTDTNMRKCIPVQERLAVALRFLATGDSYSSLSSSFKFSTQTVSKCVDEVCSALIQKLQGEIKLPETPNEWLKIAKEFESLWNFPHCLGAIGGKHIVISSAAHNKLTEFSNYKATYNSVVLLALVDANYCFIFVDIGSKSKISDESAFQNLFEKLDPKLLNLPPDNPLPLQKISLPYVFTGDDTFPLTVNMMTPYPGVHDKETKKRVFNYRLSRSCGVVANVFGIMSSVFRVLRKPILLSPEKTTNVVMACVLLHNFLRRSKSSSSLYSPIGTFDTETDGQFQAGLWQNDQKRITSLIPLCKVTEEPGLEAKTVRDTFAQYFTTYDVIPWQDKY